MLFSSDATPRSSSGETTEEDDAYTKHLSSESEEDFLYHKRRPSKSYSDLFSEEEEVTEPTNTARKSTIQMILGERMVDDNKEYFVKYKQKSYRNCSWITEEDLLLNHQGSRIIKRYKKKYPYSPPQPPYFPQVYLEPEKII